MTDYDRTFLSVDYGRRRIGIAKSDPTGLIASAIATLEVKSKREAVEAIRKAIVEYEPNALVVGYPRYPSGDISPMCEEIDSVLIEISKTYNGPIHRVDEDYTSSEAASVIHAHGKRTGKDKGRLDRIAAVIILQRYLDEHPQG